MNNENHVIIPEDFFIGEVRKIAKTVSNLIEFRGYSAVVLDFSKCKKCFPDAIIPIISLCRSYSADGVKFKLIQPTNHSLSKTFLSSNWCHLIDPNHFTFYEDPRHNRFSAHPFRDSREQHYVVNNVIECVLRVTEHIQRSHLRALEWAINEITDNVLVHSESEVGGVIQFAIKPRAKEIEFVVADSGIGIPKSLRPTVGTNLTDERILEESIKEGITRGTGQGNGLYGSFRIAAESCGAFSINSGSAYLMLSRYGKTKIVRESSPWPGTSIDCSINYARPFILERALCFRDRPHTPTDMVELKYESDDDYIKFSLKDETDSIGSRFAGLEVRRKIENLVRISEPSKILIDCSGIGIMSSSFADELFSKLIINFGEGQFREKVSIKSIDSTNLMIADRSVNQRTGRTLSDIIQEL